jgi:methyl-accepting chemotaxis protein
MADLEESLKKLDRLTQEEARIALSEVLKITHNTRDEVKVVDGKVEIVGDKVEVMGDKVADVGDRVEGVGDKVDDVGDKVHDVGDKVVDVGDKVEDLGDKVKDLGDNIHCVDQKVQVVIDGARGLSPRSLIPSEIHTFRRQGSKRRGKGNQIDCTTGGQQHR